MLNENLNGKLEMFNFMHLFTLLVLISIIVLFYIFRNKISNDRFEKVFRIFMGFFLLTFESLFHIWIYSRGSYSLSMIPLTGFCALTNVVTIILLFTNKTKYFKYVIYYALTGALFSLVFVDTPFGFPHFRYFHYFFVHFGFLLTSLYYYFTNRIEVSRKSYIISTIILFIYTQIVLIFDVLLHENWFYLIENPIKEISDALGNPWYTILWMIFNISFNYLWYIIIKRRKHDNHKVLRD